MIDPRAPNADESVVECKTDFSDQCPDADEELDDKFPKLIMKELQTTTLVDADHGHDKKMTHGISLVNKLRLSAHGLSIRLSA